MEDNWNETTTRKGGGTQKKSKTTKYKTNKKKLQIKGPMTLGVCFT